MIMETLYTEEDMLPDTIDDTIQGLLAGNFKSLELILSQLPLESHPEIAEICYDFFTKHKQFDALMKWSLHYEIRQTKEYNLLFREDCFSVNILNRVLFDPIGTQYLNTLIGPTIRAICKMPNALQIDPSKVDPQTAKENVIFLVEQCKQILSTLMRSRWACPANIREIFYWIHTFVEKKFPRKSEDLFILDFFFFQLICPSLVNPTKYGIVSEIPDHSLSGLILASKLMKDTAMGVTDRWSDPTVISFITKYRPLVLTYIRSLLNEEEIYISKQVMHSSSLQVEFSHDEKNMSVGSVRTFLHNYALLLTKKTEEVTIPVSRDSPEMYQLKLRQFWDKKNDPAWKKAKEYDEALVYTLKEKDNSVVSVKTEVLIRAPVTHILSVIKEHQWSSHGNPQNLGVELLSNTGHYYEYRVMVKMPFPLKNRDMAISQWEYILSSDHAVLVMDNLVGEVGNKKGFVRTRTYVCGWEIELETPDVCRVSYVSHADPRGHLPAWMVNALCLNSMNKIVNLKRLIEFADL